jgi:hypothetical protein
MLHLSPRRLASLALSLAILALPIIVTALSAAPGCPIGCSL